MPNINNFFPFKCNRDMVADWVEISVLNDGVFRFQSFGRMLDDEGDIATSNFGKYDEYKEDKTSEWKSELSERSVVLGAAYPFVYSDKELTLKEEFSSGCYAYLLCLFLSHPKDDEVLEGLNIKNNDPVRDLFQIISTIAASGYIKGSSVSFGWPRPERDGFVDALDRVCRLSMDGARIKEHPGAGAPPKVKDFEIDIISWMLTNDNYSNKIFLLSQVASGANWRSKRLRPTILDALSCWLETGFVSSKNIATALFMPFSIVPEKGDTVAQTLDYLCRNELENLIFYRNRIPFYVDYVYRNHIGDDDGVLIERLSEFKKVTDWVDITLANLEN